MCLTNIVDLLCKTGIDFKTGFDGCNSVVSQWIQHEDYFAKFLENVKFGSNRKNTSFENVDLPWFGSKFFSNSTDRIAIIAQDAIKRGTKVGQYTLRGSVTFWAHITYNDIDNECKYKIATDNYRTCDNNGYKYKAWQKTQEIINAAGCDNVYLTDAGKCFLAVGDKLCKDKEQSRVVLERELACINVSKVIILGSNAFQMMTSYTNKNYNFGDIASKCGAFKINLNGRTINCLVTYFPSNANNGRYTHDYHLNLLKTINEFSNA